MSIIEKVMQKVETDDKHHISVSSGNNVDRQSSDSGKGDQAALEAEKIIPSVTSERIDLDFEVLKYKGILVPNTMNITLSEQYRRIKMPILLNAFGEQALDTERRNLVMITSSIQNEGKSFTSFNLAMSIAKEFNHTVLYIDADVTQRMLNKVLGVTERAGLMDFLLDDEIELVELMLKTNVPGLTMLPSGKKYDHVTEMWASKRMNDLMLELSRRYSDRLVIFDTPPILEDSSASILARLVGQIVVVVEAEKTPRYVVEEALNTIDGSCFVGMVLNKSNQRDESDYGYYAKT